VNVAAKPNEAPRIVLVGMPWESVLRPSLAIGILVAVARRAGHECSALHLNLDLAARIGADVYEAFAETFELFPLGEHLFAVDAFGRSKLASEAFLARFGADASRPGGSGDPLYALRDRDIPAFLDDAARTVAGGAPDVVGFTCTFNQVLPSLALARRLKQLLPGVTILLGGACVHGPMGAAYAETFRGLVDYVFTGEADESFPAWVDAYADREPHRRIPGVAAGSHRQPARLTHDLDALPTPDFTAFFERRDGLEAAGAALPYVRHLPFESSRGCWWGQKHHCTFCGLNNDGMLFRRKSPERVVSELETLARRHGTTRFMAADNILDFKAYGDLLERLARSPLDYDLFYEIKANVRRRDVAALRRAGVWRVQPGIESFSDHVLALMRKGVTALRNVQLLKWLHEYGVSVDYNVLVGFPGETRQDYCDAVGVMRAIHHLPPPNGRSTRIRVDRFSPFHDSSESLGIRGVTAAWYYPHLIPEELVRPEAYAYFFDHDLGYLEHLQTCIEEVNDEIVAWKAADTDRRARLGAGFIEVLTYAGGRTRRHALRGLEAAVFVEADAQLTIRELRRRVPAGPPEAFEAALANLQDLGILLRVGDNVLSVVPFAEPHSEEELGTWASANVASASRRLRTRARPRVHAQ
jgi:ribosomal peptide maturation radical SAM protein 1